MSTIAMEEYELLKDSKYRMYVVAVDKALKSFEYTSEWADLISALGKLNKVLQGYTKFPVIPRRIKISKRLAQCMHPALPSGVHLKALETYDIIFKCMGTNRLAHELFIYSAGVFPLLGHAAMTIRPVLLQLYETHFVPLRERLRPALSGFLSGVLPGLETGSDHFDRTNALLEAVCEGVGSEWFYTCIWQCVRSNSPIRLPAISYVLAHCSRKLPMEDQLYLIGNDIDVMVSGLCAAVQDNSVLVQRSALDLLLVCFPIHNTQLLYADMVRLVTAALTCILRRDMSLNRRLYSWLLGSEININVLHYEHPLIKKIAEFPDGHSHVEAYFELYSYDILTEAVRITLSQSCTEVPIDIRPYRLLTSLLDKPQVGPVILDGILYDIFRSLYLSCLNYQKHKNGSIRCVSFNGDISSLKGCEKVLAKQFVLKNCQEIVKNANLLFNNLEPYYIWMYLGKLFEESIGRIKEKGNLIRDRSQVNEIGSGSPNILEICILSEFLLEIVHIDTFSENTSEILPNLFVNIITSMEENLEILNKLEIVETIQLCTKILKKIQPVTIAQTTKKESPTNKIENGLGKCEKSEQLENSTTEDKELLKEMSEIKQGLEKSKSDSKINENVSKNELTVDCTSRERSNSNQMVKKKTSPKIDKKSKNKKSKSSSKLYEMKKEDTDTSSIDSKDILRNETENIPQVSPIKTEVKHVLRCLDAYKRVFIRFLESKIISGVNVDQYFETLVQNSEKRTEDLEKLLSKCLDGAKDFESPDISNYTWMKTDVQFSTSFTDNYTDYEQAISVACNLFSEFSTFPNLPSEKSETKEIPYWLKALVTCACHPEKPSKGVQLIAMSTLLDNFCLTKSQKSNNEHEEEDGTNVLVMGILNIDHVIFIEDSTLILEKMSQTLWDLLRLSHNQNQLVLCVTLLYQIHNIFDKKYYVENVIGRYLVHENLTTEFFKRFSILWHLGRDLSLNIPNQKTSNRNFDRCILKILDNLENSKKPNLKLLSDTFLTHCLLRNDIARLLNPIFTILLMPSTARVSIRYINLSRSDSYSDSEYQNEEQTEENIGLKKIFAVSNINGNLMYHSMNNLAPKPSKRKSFLFSKANRKAMGMGAISTTTSISENEEIITKKNKDYKGSEGLPGIDTIIKSNMKLFINPLGSKEIYSDGIDGSYTKLDQNDSSQQSSNESLTFGGIVINPKTDEVLEKVDRDSGFESYNSSSRSVSESVTKTVDIESGKSTNRVKLPKSHSLDDKMDPDKNGVLENGVLVHSWSYCLSDSEKHDCELEISTAAEDFFKSSDRAIVTELLNEILDKVCPNDDMLEASAPKNHAKNVDFDLKPKVVEAAEKNIVVFPIHKHICLYYELFETSLVIYALHTLKNSLLSNPQLLIQCMATTGLKTLKIDMLGLLARHLKSIYGLGFGGEIPQEHVNFYRGYMFLDVLITVCLNYVRSFFPNVETTKLTEDDLNDNLKIQLISLEILTIIIKNLINIVQENKKGFSSYIADMLVKCKLQKTLLHCLLTSVRNFDEELTFAEEILLYNKFQLYDSHKNVSEPIEAFQVQILRLIQNLIILEYYIFPVQESPTSPQPSIQQSPKEAAIENTSFKSPVLIPDQQIFLSAILSALRHHNMKNLHENWCNMVTACLPYFRHNLKTIAINVIHQICNNIEKTSEAYKKEELSGELYPDYAVTQLNLLTVICHYCLLDSGQLAAQKGANNVTTPHTSEILTNLVNAFFSPAAADVSQTNKQNSNYYLTARKTVLGHMPRIISSVAKLWQTIVSLEKEYNGVYGNSKVVKQQLLEFLSPIAVHHGVSFLAAVSVAWYERRNPLAYIKSVLPEPNSVQSNLVYLISAIRVIPLDNLVHTVTAVIRNPPPTEGLSTEMYLEVSVLELFYCYMRNASATQLSEAWSSLLTLVKEGCSLSPPAQFLLAALLHELMIKCCPLEERKDQKDLQDVTAKLIECVSQVCGSCLEQTTWLRRNLAVKEQEDDTSSTNCLNASTPEAVSSTNYSVQAQLVLSEILAPILDICFGSSEKDKVNTILTSLMCNIVPYLKTHTLKNMPSFNACSKLLASLSSYQYTRKAWKKDVFEVLLDNNFFQMDASCLKYWKVIVDNLMTHDNTTFKDLMSRVSMTQSGSLNLFSSREQEYEQKAQLLKRLAFVIFCSEVDQYSKYMADIQEQLTSSLRLNVPGIQAQVFLCFRVILIRMSPIHVTSLWPIIISEMLQVFLQIEQELNTDTEEFSSHIRLLSALDSSWATNSNNGLHALGHPHWLRLQLATAKLLDLALLLPATALPQFQMYRWAFVGDQSTHVDIHNPIDFPTFVPHVNRIANLMDQRFVDSQIETLPTKLSELLLTTNAISQLKDLHSFFKTLSLCSNRHRTECNFVMSSEQTFQDRHVDKKVGAIMEKIDRVIENDFLDKLSR